VSLVFFLLYFLVSILSTECRIINHILLFLFIFFWRAVCWLSFLIFLLYFRFANHPSTMTSTIFDVDSINVNENTSSTIESGFDEIVKGSNYMNGAATGMSISTSTRTRTFSSRSHYQRPENKEAVSVFCLLCEKDIYYSETRRTRMLEIWNQ